MRYRNAEDRLNPETPEGVDDTTLAGYPAVHGRAPAFEGADGEPYTAAMETDHTDDPDAPWSAYLIFLRWARTGTAIMGHLETADLVTGPTEDAVREELGRYPLDRVKQILDTAIARPSPSTEADDPSPPADA